MRFRLTFLLWLLTAHFACAELAIGKPEWGFDGRVIAQSFNLLTVEVRNLGAQPFEGTLVLDDGGGFGRRMAAPYVQQVFIAPGAARSVQFYPYVGSGFNDLRISWKENGGGEVPVDAPSAGAPAVVLLADYDAPNLRNLRVRAFNEANFPPTAAGTDALHAAVLDHQPRWDPARREAFLDWVKRGGLVHLLHGPDGAIPQFTGELAALNIAGPQGAVGSGLVVKHAIARTELTQEVLRDAGYPAPELAKNLPSRYESSDHGIFRQLSQVTKPNIAWGIIYTLTLVYVCLVGPVFYFLRKRDYRMLLGGFVSAVVLFAWLFTVIGRRGYGEKQVYHTIALARAIDGAKWDVRHWVHAFATSGDTYRFSFQGPSQLFAALSDDESVRGQVVQGREAFFAADIPLFSSRPFLHQGVLNGPQLAWQIAEFTGDKDASLIRALRLKEPPGFTGEILHVVAQRGEKFYRLERKSGDWHIGSRGGMLLGGALNEEERFEYSYHNEDAEMVIERLRNSPMRLARAVTGDPDSPRPVLGRELQPEQIRLFTYTSAPDAFPMTSEDFQAGLSLVLFVQELAAPSATDVAAEPPQPLR